ncbi:PREDICTED: uncharacterized protein LOC107071169 [Polistes dominula]|uniref:Uncharacterized protein LOC107071169 n=1 Tax=Polistes dominula TaxID=743375 RepID=A0ABM1IYW9_POLDO|nr:PREDICTED: uncharacterized protein LOC107071169 [Polistes dominula]
MKLIYNFLVLLFVREAFGAVARKPPAFSNPVYSNAYLPAAMQVIFHAVDQLKIIQAEKTMETTSIASTSSSISSTSTFVQMNEPTTMGIIDDDDNTKETEIMEMAETVTKSFNNKNEEKLYYNVEYPTTTLGSSIIDDEHQELPESHEETPEMNYATPETNYEKAEMVEKEDTIEMNQELPEINEEESNIDSKDLTSSTTTTTTTNTKVSVENQPSIDSIVEGIYEILKPTSTDIYEDGYDEYNENLKKEKIEEENDENRFMMLGEKVTQVPRPSLSNYLKRAKVEPRASLVQLASLYDALGKDARKQGYGKYFGYSKEVLQVLETSSEGGIGPQLKTLLDKLLERNELTREDAKNKTNMVIRDLQDPASELSKDLRNLLPLRFSS